MPSFQYTKHFGIIFYKKQYLKKTDARLCLASLLINIRAGSRSVLPVVSDKLFFGSYELKGNIHQPNHQ